MDIVVQVGSLLEAKADVIVNAANSTGTMGGGVAAAIRRAGGSVVESEAMAKAPIPVGEAVLTTAGALRFRGVIHAPTMGVPAAKIGAENVYKATLAALKVAESNGFASVAFPGMGTGVGSVPHAEAAAQMIAAIRDSVTRSVQLVLLVDIDGGMTRSWQEEIARGERL